jgi:hypothetical protein
VCGIGNDITCCHMSFMAKSTVNGNFIAHDSTLLKQGLSALDLMLTH